MNTHVTASAMAERLIDVLRHRVGKDERAAKQHDWFNAAILTLRDDIIDSWMESTRRTYAQSGKRVYYLSLEFLIGRLMRDALSNMGLTREMAQALREHGLDLATLEDLEPDAALGNGGLGRLAACFMESLASLDIPAYGYGIRYVNGMFRQRIDDGWQVELPETWLASAPVWSPALKASSRIGSSALAVHSRSVFTRFPRQPTTGVSTADASTSSAGFQTTVSPFSTTSPPKPTRYALSRRSNSHGLP